MKFRTEIGPVKGSFTLTHDDHIVMLGSCFADNIGERLAADGFDVVHNPMGPLFNPASIARVLRRGNRSYGPNDFFCHDGIWHCLDFASRYQASDTTALADMVNTDYSALRLALDKATAIFITFGTNKVYLHQGQTPVGNCHKIPASQYTERFLSIDEIYSLWQEILPSGIKTLFTLSPVRYPGDGLPQSTLSKAMLRVALDRICREGSHDYFPAYEIVTDDLRDYRFYGPDLRHPTQQAVEYIYEHFSSTYFSEQTRRECVRRHKETLRAAHRQIIYP